VSGARTAPLSDQQEPLWLLHQLMPDAAVDNECVTLILRGPLDPGVLQDSLAAFVERHEIWRTVFDDVNGRPVQVVRPTGSLALTVRDIRNSPETARQLAENEARRPFDLARGPLVRALLVRLADQEHRLYLTLHRIISDREALTRVFLPELGKLYTGRADELAEPVQYIDDVPQAGADHLSFWTRYLAGAPAVLELPGDHRRRGPQSYRGGAAEFALGAELTAGLAELSRQEQVSLDVTLAAAFAALLQRYTGQEDLLLGLAVPGPDVARPVLGPRGNTVVLRADLAGEPTVRDLLARTRAAARARRGHEHVPFGQVVRAMQPERSVSHQPLVQALLAIEPAPPALPAGWELAPPQIPVRAAKFDLCLEVGQRGGELAGRLSYNSDLFGPETIGRMIGHWRMVLRGMAAEPWRPVGELELLAGQERRRLLEEWSQGGPPPPGPDVASLIEEQARTRPDAVAAVCAAEQVSYRELNERANQLARYLRDCGAGPEVPVGVCLDRSLGHLIALVAILKAGGGYVPLDPGAPAERTGYIVADTGMPLVLTQHRLRDRFGGARAAVISLDRDAAAIARYPAQDLAEPPADPGQLGYVIYTSGSTGKPKGAMIDRGVMSAHTRAMIEQYRLGPQDRVLQFSGYSADASLEQILPALACGARLVMRGTEIWSPRQLLEEIQAHQVTVMNFSPTYWQQAVREWARAPQALAGLAVRLVILGGERLSPQSVQQWRELGLSGVRLLNAYGPTEAAITATLGEAGQEQDPVTIGRPLPGRTGYVLDRGGRPVPAGVLGELHIGGPLLARGYVNLPELTKERFVPDPFGPQENGRLYRTGDVVRWLGDGRIEYLGREDHQVKIRGYRIELGEVEAALAGHPAVEEAVVVARGDDETRELVAYWVAGQVRPPAEEELRGYLRGKLPRHMRPAVIERLEQMPRLATGKPDRRNLPEVTRRQRREEGDYLAPQLMVHQQLVQIWEDLLEPRPIGIRDNFFHLGGHSLLAAQLVDRIEQACGRRLPLSTVFARPTVEQLAAALAEGETGPAAKAPVLPVQAGGSRTPFFFLHGDWTGGAFYCFALARACGPEQPFYVLAPYAFDHDEGAPSLTALARAHIESMRTVRPRGPYRLGGFCNGGLLAYEMARQLEQEGERVEFLALLNPSPPVQSSLLRTGCERLSRLGRVPERKRADLYLRARHAQRHIYRHLRPGSMRVADFGQLLDIDPRLAAMFPPRDALYHDYVGVFSWSAAGYRTGIYPGEITFYWARDEPAIARTWRSVISRKKPGDTAEHTVDGTHMGTVTDHIEEMSALLGRGLDEVSPR
jgi:amino acid adenylation domain-containing protein